jgi:hypothetical protein
LNQAFLQVDNDAAEESGLCGVKLVDADRRSAAAASRVSSKELIRTMAYKARSVVVGLVIGSGGRAVPLLRDAVSSPMLAASPVANASGRVGVDHTFDTPMAL